MNRGTTLENEKDGNNATMNAKSRKHIGLLKYHLSYLGKETGNIIIEKIARFLPSLKPPGIFKIRF